MIAVSKTSIKYIRLPYVEINKISDVLNIKFLLSVFFLLARSYAMLLICPAEFPFFVLKIFVTTAGGTQFNNSAFCLLI